MSQHVIWKDSILQELSLCSIFLRHDGQNLRSVYGTPQFPKPPMRLRQRGCAMIWILSEGSCSPRAQRASSSLSPPMTGQEANQGATDVYARVSPYVSPQFCEPLAPGT